MSGSVARTAGQNISPEFFIKKAQTSLDKIELRAYLRYELGLTIQRAPPGLGSRLRPNEDLLGR